VLVAGKLDFKGNLGRPQTEQGVTRGSLSNGLGKKDGTPDKILGISTELTNPALCRIRDKIILAPDRLTFIPMQHS